jgi:hypothetical protein
MYYCRILSKMNSGRTEYIYRDINFKVWLTVI